MICLYLWMRRKGTSGQDLAERYHPLLCYVGFKRLDLPYVLTMKLRSKVSVTQQSNKSAPPSVMASHDPRPCTQLS